MQMCTIGKGKTSSSQKHIDFLYVWNKYGYKYKCFPGKKFCNIFFHVIFNIFHWVYSNSRNSLWHNQILESFQLKSEWLRILPDNEKLGNILLFKSGKNANVAIEFSPGLQKLRMFVAF